MERETKKITTPSGREIDIKTYLTGREANQIKQVMLGEMTMDVETGTPSAEISGAFMIDQEKKLIEILVVSIDGDRGDKPGAITEKILDLRNEDYQFIIKAVNEIYSANLTQAK